MAVITLTHPIQVDGKDVTELTVPTRLTLGALQLMDNEKGEIGKLAGLIAGAFKIPLSSARQMDVADLEAVSEALFPLLPTSGLGGIA